MEPSFDAIHLSSMHDALDRIGDYQVLPPDEKEVYLSNVVLSTLKDLNITPAELEQRGIHFKPLNDIIIQELSCTRYLTWASVDNFIEKMIQGLVISKEDLNNKEKNCCKDGLKQMIRQMPHGRSLLLQDEWGLKKVSAARGIVRGAELTLGTSVSLFIGTALSYRLIELARTGASDFAEFTSVFKENSEKGVVSLVQLLAKVDSSWLYLLMASPLIFGALKGVFEGCKSQKSKERDLADLQFAVNEHTKPLTDLNSKLVAYLWEDNARQYLPIPGLMSVTERMQDAERFIRWNGTVLLSKQRIEFDNIKIMTSKARGMSKLYAMQCLAKIIHSLSIKDFAAFQKAGIPKDRLEHILQLKAEALHGLRVLAGNELPADKQASIIQRSMASTLYACYLLWWLGLNPSKTQGVAFAAFKAGKATLTALFISEIVKSITQAINCPDKPGFKMFYGDYEIWANKLTVECFNEFLRQFRLVSRDEPIEPFLEQLENFHLDGVTSLNLRSKGLNAEETQAILKIIAPKMRITNLDLSFNKIGEDVGKIDFPDCLIDLNMESNKIGPNGAKGIRLPEGLGSFNINFNNIRSEGAKALNLPKSLKSLDLGSNRIDAVGLTDIVFPSELESLVLDYNNLGPEVTSKLELIKKIKDLSLKKCKLGDSGLKNLKLSATIEILDISDNQISDEGFIGFKCSPKLQSLNLGYNQITSKGLKANPLPSTLKELRLMNNKIGLDVKGWILPAELTYVNLAGNQLGVTGAKNLQLPPGLLIAFLDNNEFGPEGVKGLKLPPTIIIVGLDNNNMGNSGLRSLKIPLSVEELSVMSNGITSDGISNFKPHEGLKSLFLSGNKLGAKGIKLLICPSTLEILYLENTDLGNEGCRDLRLNQGLKELFIGGNLIEAEGIKNLVLPDTLQQLSVEDNNLGVQGAKYLNLPNSIQHVDMDDTGIGNEGAKLLRFPPALDWLSIRDNLISDEGIRAIFQKIFRTNLRHLYTSGNDFNATAINDQRIFQQQQLLKSCQDQLCHSNTPLIENDDVLMLSSLQTSSATRLTTPFSWLKRPLAALADRVDGFFKSTGTQLRVTLADTPSYFPHIGSLDLHDFHPHGSLLTDHYHSIADYACPSSLGMGLVPYSMPLTSLGY
ncbi:MAG: hypothetical protein H0W88_07440 [Parachlamydiaceae bacterium]|nr:hypothetical protein [Parachlamydiaceae bacterium]